MYFFAASIRDVSDCMLEHKSKQSWYMAILRLSTHRRKHHTTCWKLMM